MSEMINLTIDGIAISVPKGTTVYQACQQLKINVPIFCYQDRMPPFGACRVCLVEVEKMGKLQASCTLEATEGMVVNTQSQQAVDGRKGILELLLINHPLDCPICDRGGECPLQEQALDHGPGKSRFYEEKRHFTKALPLGPVLMLDRERCIVCARCTRFGDLLAGDHALELLDRGYRTEVGTPDQGPAKSKFIGNTIMICPVGALTSQVYRFRARPWDNESTPSTCTLCPVGCSLYLDSRDGEIMRTRSRENRDVNDIWLCDKGWFGYEFTANPARLQKPFIRHSGKLVPASWDEAFALIGTKLQQAKQTGKAAAFGGTPLTVEENYLFQRLFRKGVGSPHLDYRIGMPTINHDGISPGMEINIGECETLSYAYLLGLDLTEEFPVIWLRLRQAINKGAKVIFMGNYAPEIQPFLHKTVVHAPGKELEMLKEHLTQQEGKGALLVGRQYLESPQRNAILQILLEFQNSAPELSLNVMEGKGNSMGACLAGMCPGHGPLNKKLEQSGMNALEVVQAAASSGWDYLHVAGADPATKFSRSLWRQAREKLGFLVVQDLFITQTAQDADVVLPVLSSIEKGGHFLNIEGRLQTLLPGKEIPKNIYSDAQIFKQIASNLNVNLMIEEDFLETLKQAKVSLRRSHVKMSIQTVPAASHQLRAVFAVALFDHGVRMLHDPHMVQLARAPRIRIHPHEAMKRNLEQGSKVRITTNSGSAVGELELDRRIAFGTLVLPLGFEEFAVHELGNELFNGLPVDIQKEG